MLGSRNGVLSTVTSRHWTELGVGTSHTVLTTDLEAEKQDKHSSGSVRKEGREGVAMEYLFVCFPDQ